jgi:concanavalin A-like lectin/glucanase superfamily protein
VLVNVTAVDATEGTHLELYGQTFRNKWTMTAYPGEEPQTLTMVPIAEDGAIRVQNYTGSVHAVVDLVGWYGTGGSGARYVPLRHVLPTFDSRTGTQTSAYPFGPAQSRAAQVRRLPRVPYDASAVMLNVTLTAQTRATSAALWCQECGWRGHANVSGRPSPDGAPPRPQSNAAVLPMGATGWGLARNDQGVAHMSAALSGYFVGGQMMGDTPVPAPVGHWKFDEGTGSTTADSSGNGTTVTIHPTASWVGGRTGRATRLDGATAYASTTGPVIRTDQSFTVMAWVYLDRNDTWRTVIGQDGGNRVSPFVLQYSKSLNTWAFNTIRSDVDNPQELWTAASSPARLGEWTHLAAVYDAPAQEIRLYVNGARDGATTGATIWRADGPFLIGRTKYNGNYGQNFPGGIDEVRAYDRALVDSEVRELHRGAPAQLIGHWKFDEGTGTTTADSAGSANHGTLRGEATWTAGTSGQAVQLNGTSAHVDTRSRGVITMDSFTVSAWAQLNRTEGFRTVVSQDGNVGSGFYLQYSAADNCWALSMFNADRPDATTFRALSGTPPTLGAWTHLAGVYDAGHRQLRLYVNGILVDTTDGVKTWNATGGLVVGRAKYGGNPVDYFPGVVDDVRTYQGVLPEAEIHALATR